MGLLLSGRIRRLGDDVDTDTIIASRRKRETLDPAKLKAFLLESHDPAFAATVREDDIIVAGRNFGCGSAMEVAVTVVLGAGIRTVVAESFARTYFRNAVNNGLLPVICDTAGLEEGEALEIHAEDEAIFVRAGKTERPAAALPPVMRAIIDAGGLVPYLRRHGGFNPPPASARNP